MHPNNEELKRHEVAYMVTEIRGLAQDANNISTKKERARFNKENDAVETHLLMMDWEQLRLLGHELGRMHMSQPPAHALINRFYALVTEIATRKLMEEVGSRKEQK